MVLLVADVRSTGTIVDGLGVDVDVAGRVVVSALVVFELSDGNVAVGRSIALSRPDALGLAEGARVVIENELR